MYRAYYKPMSKRPTRSQPKDLAVPADRVWAAAAYAHRMNAGEYFKEPRYLMDANGIYSNEVAQLPNRVHMWKAIEDESLLTDADREFGRQVRDWTRKDLMVKTLKGTMRDFDVSMATSAEREHFVLADDRYEIALVCSRPRAYEDARQIEQAMEGISRMPLAPVGTRVNQPVTVVKTVYSQNYGVFFITAVTESRHAVFFSYRERLAVGYQCRVRGTVKAHRENSTQLNRVRIA